MLNPKALSTLALMTLVTISQSALSAGSCPAVDLRDQLGPARRQAPSGWCHSFAAADLISAKLGYEVSSADIARHYFPERGLFSKLAGMAKGGDSEIYFAGSSTGALETALKHGVCNERFFPFDVISSHLNTPVETEAKKFCDNYRVSLAPYFTYQSRTVGYGDGQAEKVIQEQLLKSNIVAIDFDGYHISNARMKADASFLGSGHASTVVGMRPSPKGDCEYLIRGSWGAQCDSYDKTLDCEAGNVWVSGSSLSYMVMFINWLEKRQ